jgi:hypothetical protein
MPYGYKTSLKVGTASYDVNVVSYAFDKSINESGQVTSPVEGGTMFLSLAEIPKKNILQWGIEKDSYKSGIIETIGIDDEKPIADEEIAFESAACVNLKLIYEKEHSGYFTTLLTISPKKICMGRTNCWLNKEWTLPGEPESESVEEIPDVEDFIPKDVAIDGFLYVMGKQYEIQAFETEFTQPSDWKGQPQDLVKGGLLLVTLSQIADEILNDWMFKPGVSHDGLIVFAPISRTANAPLRIKFEGGKCISFEKMKGTNVGIQTSLLISSEVVHFNEVKHQN